MDQLLRRVFSKGQDVESFVERPRVEEDEMQQMKQDQKRMQDEIRGMKQDFEDGLAVQAAFQNGVRSGSNLEVMSLPGTNGGEYLPNGLAAEGAVLSTTVSRNLAALDGLCPGELVKRLDLLQGAVETLLARLAQPQSKEAAVPAPAALTPSPPPVQPPATVPPPAIPPPATASPPEAKKPEAPRMNGGMPAVVEEKEEPKRWDVHLTRDVGQSSWGLQWDRRAFNEKRRIVEAVVADSPSGRWNKEHESSDEKLQKGDELLALNGKTGWLACSELSRLQQAQLTFQRASDGKKKVIRFEASGTSPARAKTPEQSSMPARSLKTAGPAPADTAQGTPASESETLRVLQSALSDTLPSGVGFPPRQQEFSTIPPATRPAPGPPGKLKMQEPAVPDLAATTQSPRTTEQQRQELALRKQKMEQQKAFLKRMSSGEENPVHAPAPQAAHDLVQARFASLEQPSSTDMTDVKPTLTKPSADDLTKLATLLAQGEAGSALELVQPLLRKQVRKGEIGEPEFTTVDTREAARFLVEVMEVMEANSSQAGFLQAAQGEAAPLLT
mmetsp:Transcript_85929/g.152228  ORF Transcript_85929/g.152228 Transcript_85929/m.152228 type:complete len:557 (+) Transcript_85929:74-1744(+)